MLRVPPVLESKMVTLSVVSTEHVFTQRERCLPSAALSEYALHVR